MVTRKSISLGIVLLALGLLSAAGCPFGGPFNLFPPGNQGAQDDPDAVGEALLSDNAARLPDVSLRAQRWLSYEETPDDTLLGVLMEDGSRIHLLGEVTDAGAVNITGADYYDADGKFVLRQTLRPSGTVLIFATGDGMTLDHEGDNLHVVFQLAASTPASTIDMTVDAQENVTLNGADIYTGLNSSYTGKADGSSKPRMPAKTAHYKQSNIQAGCTTAGDALVNLASIACDLKSALTTKLPDKVLNGFCILAKRVFDAAEVNTEALKRVISGLKAATSLSCSFLKAAAQGLTFAGYITKMNPVDLICFALGPLTNSTRTVTGQTLSNVVCDAWLPDDRPDDAMPPNYHFGSSTCPFGTYDVGGGLCCPADWPHLWSDGLCRSTYEPGACPDNFTAAGEGRCCPTDIPYFWQADGRCHGTPENMGGGGCAASNVPVGNNLCCPALYPYLWSDSNCHAKPESNLPTVVCPPFGLVICTCQDKHYCLGIYCNGQLYHDAGTFCESFSCDP